MGSFKITLHYNKIGKQVVRVFYASNAWLDNTILGCSSQALSVRMWNGELH